MKQNFHIVSNLFFAIAEATFSFKNKGVFLWDECTMTNKVHFEALDRTLQDLKSNNKPMGGITVILAGDFR